MNHFEQVDLPWFPRNVNSRSRNNTNVGFHLYFIKNKCVIHNLPESVGIDPDIVGEDITTLEDLIKSGVRKGFST